MKLIKQPISDKHYAIITCDICSVSLAKLFKDCEGCFINQTFFNICDNCWTDLK
jgi:hypothetical protein